MEAPKFSTEKKKYGSATLTTDSFFEVYNLTRKFRVSYKMKLSLKEIKMKQSQGFIIK